MEASQRKIQPPESQTPSLTDESLAEARSLIGIWLSHRHKALTVTGDIMRHYAHYTGDDNPLFCEDEYARNTRWGGLIAPPTLLYMVHSTIIAPKLRGIQWIYAGTDWEWFLPVRTGDLITGQARLIDAVEKKGTHVPRMILQSGEVIYRNQRDEVVARAVGKTMRTPRSKASGGMSYQSRQQKYTGEELETIEEACSSEVRRGSTPRYWQDVQEGEELPPVVKGPLRVTDIAICLVAAGGEGEVNIGQGSHIYQLLHRRRHPDDAYIDPETGTQDHPHRGHWEAFMAQEVGMPGIYDLGYQRVPWLAHLMTNWIGDDGFLKKLETTLRRPNVVGDITWCKGKVTRKYIEDGEHLVECQVWGENQLGEVNMPGKAVAALPSKTG